MAVRKIRNSWWVDITVERRRHRIKSPENTRHGAQAYELVLRNRLRDGGTLFPTKAEAPSFEEFAKKWFGTYVCTNLRASTIRKYEYALRTHLIPWFGRRRLNVVSGESIERYKQHELAAGLKAKTINGYLSILRRCLDTAQEWGELSSLPRIKWLKCEPPPFDFLSFVESARLLAAPIEEPWPLMIHCALRTGMRVGELIALRWECVNLEHRLITVRRSLVRGVESSPKSNRIRHVPISGDLLEALDGVRRASGYVFADAAGMPVKHERARRALGRAMRAAGIRPVGWHTLRHTFASQLASRGVPLQAIQAFLGHATIQMTMRYAHLLPSAYSAAVNELAAGEAHAVQNIGHLLGTERGACALPEATG